MRVAVSAAGAPALPPGWHVVPFATVGSTNDEAKALARAGAAEGTVVWSLRQESGRGRRGRAWVSPEGNLYTSTVLRPGCAPVVAAQLSFVAALAIADTAVELLPSAWPVRCKWPNDVLVNGRKVSGILLESEPAADGGIDWLVLGVGVNLRHFPEDTEHAATSLLAEGAAAVEPAEALTVFARHLAGRYAEWQGAGFVPVRRAWLERASGLGQAIRVRLPAETIEGVFTDLDSDGVLLLDRADGGGLRRVAAGEVFFSAAGPAGTPVPRGG